MYNGTTAATLTSCTVTGALGGDVVACTGTASFATAAVGTGKTVTATGLTLTGAAASNYVLSSTTASTAASVTPATVTPVDHRDEQGLQRDDGCDAHELHGHGRRRWRCGGLHGQRHV